MIFTSTKVCHRCHLPKLCSSDKSGSEFYVRSGIDEPTEIGHFLTECKECLKARGLAGNKVSPLQPRSLPNVLATEYFANYGIPSLPGTLAPSLNTDLILWGCVRCAVKYSAQTNDGFSFTLTKNKTENRMNGDLLLLICDYGTHQTFHLFSASDPIIVFLNGRSKRVFTFTPGRKEQLKHQERFVSLTQPIMDSAQDRLELVEQARLNWKAHWLPLILPEK